MVILSSIFKALKRSYHGMIQSGPFLYLKEAWYNEFQYHKWKYHEGGHFTCTLHASIIFDMCIDCIMILSSSESTLNVSWYNQVKNLKYFLQIVCSLENRTLYTPQMLQFGIFLMKIRPELKWREAPSRTHRWNLE